MKLNGKPVKVSNYSYLDYVDFAKNRKASKTDKKRSRECSGYRTEFTGTKNFTEAIELAEKGWDAGIKKLASENNIKVIGTVDYTPSLVGSVVNIGNYVQGLPNNMFEINSTIDYHFEEVNIYVPLTYSAFISKEKAIQRAIDIVKIVNEIQTTKAVKIVGIFSSTHNRYIHINEITIKETSDNLVLNSIAYSFHPSFFRRLEFSVNESYEDWDTFGYGRPLGQSEIKEYLKDKKGYLVPNLTSNTSTLTKEDLIKL